MKKRIMIFGDSNTWGADPRCTLDAPSRRFEDDVRWAGVLQRELGDAVTVIPEGLNGRTTVMDDPVEEYRRGKDQIIPCLQSQAPLDLVIIMLGTNDLKPRFSMDAEGIANGAGLIVEKTLNYKDAFSNYIPKVLLICPPPLGDITKTVFCEMFKGGVEKSRQLGAFYEKVAKKYGVEFFDAGKVIHSSEEDGVHLMPDQHEILGKEIAKVIKEGGLL